MQDNNLRLINIFVHEEEKNPVLDITLYNRSNQTVLPTRAKIEVLDVGEFYDCDDDQTRSFIPITHTYTHGIVLSPSSRGQAYEVKISHLLRPEESDRFQLVISQRVNDPAPVYVWYLLKVTIIYDEQDHNITSQPILISIPPVNPNNYDVWETGNFSCIARNISVLHRMAAQAAQRSSSVEAAIQPHQITAPGRDRSSTSSLPDTIPLSPATPSSTNDPIEIFFSYAQEDEALAKKLDEQLALAKRRNLITNWHTGKIALGKNVKQQILDHLHQAHIILLLISPDFIAASQYDIINDAIKQGNIRKRAIIIPVLLRPTATLQDTFFDELPILPRNGKAIKTWASQDLAFAQVAEEIISTVKQLKQQNNT